MPCSKCKYPSMHFFRPKGSILRFENFHEDLQLVKGSLGLSDNLSRIVTAKLWKEYHGKK